MASVSEQDLASQYLINQVLCSKKKVILRGIDSNLSVRLILLNSASLAVLHLIFPSEIFVDIPQESF